MDAWAGSGRCREGPEGPPAELAGLPMPPPGLRWWHEADDESLLSAWRDPSIAAWTSVPENVTRNAARRWIAGAAVRWSRRLALDLVIVDRDGGVAGEVGLARFTHGPERAEIGFWLRPAARGEGAATAAVIRVSAWALSELGLEQLWARTDPRNEAAAAVLERAGFARLGEAGNAVVWACSSPAEGPATVTS